MLIYVFYWGYNYQYPVAKIENMSYSNIALGLETYLNQLDDYTVIDDSNRESLYLVNQNIRKNLPSGALITTYTYDPLIGITSQTDTNGRTTYFEYDDFGRLRYIKDHDGHIINNYEYHYKKTTNP